MPESLSEELRRELREELADGRLTTVELASYLMSEEARQGLSKNLHDLASSIHDMSSGDSWGRSAWLMRHVAIPMTSQMICHSLVEEDVVASVPEGFASHLPTAINQVMGTERLR